MSGLSLDGVVFGILIAFVVIGLVSLLRLGRILFRKPYYPIVLVALGGVLGAIIGPKSSTVTAPFFIGSVVVLLVLLIRFIGFIMHRLNGKISRRAYNAILILVIAGILGGILGLFQPWSVAVYALGFPVLLYSALGFTVWSHIQPRPKAQS